VLPESITSTLGGASVIGYPALVDAGSHAALRVMASGRERDDAHPTGVRRLLLSECALSTKRVTTRWSGTQALALASSPYPSTEALVDDLQRAAIARLTPAASDVRDVNAYERARADVRDRLEDAVHALVRDVLPVLDARRDLEAAIGDATSMALLSTLADIRDHTGALVGAGFIGTTPEQRLRDLPRYLKAATHRLSKAAQDPDRDASLAWQVREVASEVDAARQAQARSTAARGALVKAPWLVEELRVSLFAQHLGTSEPVSATRIRALLAAEAR
jgi:ATP-dependent helicase HrpA